MLSRGSEETSWTEIHSIEAFEASESLTRGPGFVFTRSDE